MGLVQACHNFLISQTGFQQPGFWITMVGFRIPLAGFRIPNSGLPYMGRITGQMHEKLTSVCQIDNEYKVRKETFCNLRFTHLIKEIDYRTNNS